VTRIAITSGDPDGIGTEVTSKALTRLKDRKDIIFYVFRSKRCPRADLQRIDRAMDRIEVNSWADALKAPARPGQLVDVQLSTAAASWVETAAQACLFGHLDALVTGPLSKTSIAQSGLKDLGHTGILKRVAKADHVHMGFIGEKFSVLLATGHVPIADVEGLLTVKSLGSAVSAANHLRQLLDKRISGRPLALLGLNPHSGEDGLIGGLEQKVHSVVLAKARAKKIPIEGPLVPDVAFDPGQWKIHSVFVANYHDQGLIPFKMIHGQHSGIHITMGLPFVRTSVDHGTAKDIFGRDRADHRSMLQAIEWADRLARNQISVSEEDYV
jgi:4-hydroxythreonine-4-phosphate dehydrogenase